MPRIADLPAQLCSNPGYSLQGIARGLTQSVQNGQEMAEIPGLALEPVVRDSDLLFDGLSYPAMNGRLWQLQKGL